MGNEWIRTTLGDIMSFTNGKASPLRHDGLPYPVYGANGIIGFSEKENASECTIVIGRVGSYCGSIYFSKQKCWVTDNAIRANAQGLNVPLFLSYLLSTLNLNHMRGGSGQPLLNQTILSSIPVSVPPHNEQRTMEALIISS